jgi:hypothetical protein
LVKKLGKFESIYIKKKSRDIKEKIEKAFKQAYLLISAN